jgi:hypothetical protein
MPLSRISLSVKNVRASFDGNQRRPLVSRVHTLFNGREILANIKVRDFLMQACEGFGLKSVASSSRNRLDEAALKVLNALLHLKN